jgi:hypothetical protein
VTFYNYAIFTVIKHLSALAEEINSNLEVVLTWLIGIGVTLYFKEENIYQWESLDYKVILIQIAGFFCIISGGLIYNGLFVFLKENNK